MARVFISHATADLEVAREVRDWLAADGHDPFLAAHLGGGIAVGEDWKQRLYAELRRSDAVLCVVTEAFVASNWCAAEVGIADLLGCRLLPLRVAAGVVHPLMEHLQYAEFAAGGVRERLDRALRQVEAGGRTRWRDGDNPFPGLEPFTSALSELFFGRDEERRELAGLLRADARGGLLAVVGPSGSGKSSLLRAGVLPSLELEHDWLVVPPWLPGDDPRRELAVVLAARAARQGLGWSVAEVRDRLDAEDGLLRVAEDLVATRSGGGRLLVAVDQAEELFTRAPEGEREAVAVLLREALEGPVRVVATLRSEFLDDLRALPALAGVSVGAYVLAPLDRDVLREVITGPARVAGLGVDPKLVGRLVADTGSGEALPLLAFTLRRLASGCSRGDELTVDRYRSLGGVDGALTRHADATLERAAARSGLSAEEVLAALVRLVGPGHRGWRRVVLAGLSDPLRVALGVFVDRRLLTASGDGWVGVAHEALFTAWEPLRRAVAERSRALQAAWSAERAAAEWEAAGRSDAYLWEADRVVVTRAALGLPSGAAGDAAPLVGLEPVAREFLEAARLRVEEVRRREHRRRRRGVLVLSVLLVLALGASVVAGAQWGVARGERDTAAARALVAQAEAARGSSPRLALRLGLAAHRLRPGPETHAGLVNTLITTRYAGALPGGGSMSAFSPDGRVLAVGGGPLTGVVLWDLSDPLRPRRFGAPLEVGGDRSVAALAFPAGAGSVLAVAESGGEVALWDVAVPDAPRLVRRVVHGAPVTALAFSPDGRVLAVGGSTGSTALWGVTGPAPEVLATLDDHGSRVSSLAFSPAGVLATGSDDGTAVLWDVVDPVRPVRRGEPLADGTGRAVSSLAFSHGRDLLVTGRSDGTADLWEVGSGRRRGEPLAGHHGVVSAVAFVRGADLPATGGGDGADLLVTGGDDGAAVLWDVSDPDAPSRSGAPLVGHGGPVTSVSPRPDGAALVTTSAAGDPALWEPADRPRQVGPPLTGHDVLVRSVVFEGTTAVTTGADGVRLRWDVGDPERPRQVGRDRVAERAFTSLAVRGSVDATAGGDNSVVLWDKAEDPPRLLATLTGHGNAVTAAAFSPDGRVVATGGADGGTILWDVGDVGNPRRLGRPSAGRTTSVTALAFSPDGLVVAVGDADGGTVLWDIADPNRPRLLGRPLVGHARAVNSVAFSPGGSLLATAGSDGMALLWDIAPLGDVVERACAISGGGLDPEEWRQHVPDLDHRPTC
ncbi:TIR domain-containing protein [Saccharothrix xinjiangensis]|uniref:TIR domain-containing protein n=1 Tax=Saccharothrix xinjiangensis TaxID=204798 RepID=A0ABV9YF76_9PSEU